ncbi:MAG: ribosome maturation factor RimM [Acetobacteraceae bacterium]|nr:ribosome maturation factor RimM [Acetobacteraceae bacterium]
MLIAVGQVVAPHNPRGEVRVLPLTDFPERFLRTARVFVCPPGGGEPVPLRVEAARLHRGMVLLKLEGCGDMAAAERLRGSMLKVPEEELVPLEPGRYYVFQIVGLEVFTASGQCLGRVEEVLQTGANDVYVVRGRRGGRPVEVLLPALREVVRRVDLEAGRLVVELPPGLLGEGEREEEGDAG